MGDGNKKADNPGRRRETHMHPTVRVSISLVFLTSVLAAQGAAPQLPYTPSLDPTAMDRTANPCVDFYQFACGGWVRNNPIPADQSNWSTYGKMQDENRMLLRALLEQAAQPGANRTPNQQKIGDYYSACMDEPTLERRAALPLAPQLDAIAKMRSIADMAKIVADSHALMVA